MLHTWLSMDPHSSGFLTRVFLIHMASLIHLAISVYHLCSIPVYDVIVSVCTVGDCCLLLYHLKDVLVENALFRSKLKDCQFDFIVDHFKNYMTFMATARFFIAFIPNLRVGTFYYFQITVYGLCFMPISFLFRVFLRRGLLAWSFC